MEYLIIRQRGTILTIMRAWLVILMMKYYECVAAATAAGVNDDVSNSK
jgi:hypothetical protein